MAGKFTKSEWQLRPHPRFNDRVLSKFINCVMYDGKKSTAQRVVYDALEQMQARLEKEKIEGMPATAIEMFNKAVENTKPNVEVLSKRVGGANYQVPMQVNKKRQQSLAFRWIIQSCREDGGRPMSVRLADELMTAFKKEGKAMNTREQTHRMAEANKAFAHFAW